MNRKELAFIKKLSLCRDAVTWMKTQKTLQEAWENCDRPDWMTWALRHINFDDDRKLRLFACQCVRETPLADGRKVWDLLTDERSRKAVEAAEQFAEGKISKDELNAYASAAYAYASSSASYASAASSASYASSAASYASYASSAASYASYASAASSASYASSAASYASSASYASAASSAARKKQSELLRQWISWDEVEVVITKHTARS
jgi:hypothetical protein